MNRSLLLPLALFVTTPAFAQNLQQRVEVKFGEAATGTRFGLVVTDEAGKPTGYLLEIQAMALVEAVGGPRVGAPLPRLGERSRALHAQRTPLRGRLPPADA